MSYSTLSPASALSNLNVGGSVTC